jgi:tetratricopeptide (TPR) repeat protein
MADSSSPKVRLQWAAVLVAACLVTYANGLGGAFTYDDKAIVRDNLRIRTPANLAQIFTTSYFGSPRGSGTVYRPLTLVTYAVQWWIHGRQAVAFHAVNLLLHAGATLLLASLFLQAGIPPGAGFAAALLFAVHPVHVEAVTSLVGRAELLVAIFTLLYLRLSLRLFRLPSSIFRLPTFLLALFCYALAVLSKESGASAPALAFLLFLFVSEGRPGNRILKALLRGLPVLAGSAVVLAGYFLFRHYVLGGFLISPGSGFFEVENALAPLETWPRVANACLVLFRYLGRSLFPLHLSADESAWSIDPVEGASPLAIGAVLLLAATAFLALLRLSSRCPLALGFLFFGLALLPGSNLVFPIGTIFAERLAYLASAGICLVAGYLVAGGAASPAGLSPSRRRILLAAAVLLSARAIVRNAAWWTDEGLFLNLVRTSPDSAKAHYDLAYVLADERQYARAREQYQEAIDLYEDYWDAWAGKGRTEKELGLLADAEASYLKSIESNPAYENGYFGLGVVREARGNWAGAEEAYRKGLTQKKDSLPLAYRLAVVRSRLAWPAALPDWQRALAIGPASTAVHADFARWLLREGRADEAAKEARQALRLDPQHLPALRLLAERDSAPGRAFAEGLVRERIFGVSRSPEDWALLLAAARKSESYSRRFARLERSLAPLVRPGARAGPPASVVPHPRPGA